jgi:hypothetical protein
MHHACYIEGSPAQFEEYKEKLKPFWSKSFERFGIDDARSLIELAGLKNVSDAVFFIAAGAMTTEAQQALLKLFEEPQAGTMFVLLVPHGTLIGTLRSRMMRYPSQQRASKKILGSASPQPDRFSQHAAASFLKLSQKERSAYITKLLKDNDNARDEVRELLNGLEGGLHAKLIQSKGNKAVVSGLEDIAQARSYMGDRSPSLKMLLEHLALTLPVLK